MRVVVAEEEAGGMIARLEEMKVEEAAEVDGGTIALLQGEAHLQDEEAHHIVHLQGGEVLLRKGLASSWHQGPSEVQVEVVEVAGENVRGRKRNLGALEAGTETVPPGVTRLPGGVEVDVVTLLQGEGLLQEGVHLRGGEALLVGMREEAMQEVGDVEVEALLQDEALHQDGVLLQGEARLQGEVPLQDVGEVLMMEVDHGGLDLAEEVKTEALQEGDRLQGEAPLLVGALHLAVGLLLGEVGLLLGEEVHLREEATHHAGDLRLAEMRAAAMEVPGGVAEEVVDLHLDVGLHPGEDLHPGEALHLGVMGLPAMMVPQTGDATVPQGTTELHQDPTTACRQDPMTGLLQSPLASLTKAGPRWPSVNPTWSSLLGRFDFKASPALPPWPHPFYMWVAL